MEKKVSPILTTVKGPGPKAAMVPLDPKNFKSTLAFLEKVSERHERIMLWGAVFKVVKVREGKVVLKCQRDREPIAEVSTATPGGM